MKMITIDELFCQTFDDLKVIDLVEFQSIHVLPKIDALEKYFNNPYNEIKIGKDSFSLLKNEIPEFLNKNLLQIEFTLDKYRKLTS